MVGAMMLMKILHCKRLRRRRGSKEAHSERVPGSSTVKVEVQSVDYTCRVCLKEGDISIFGEDGSDDLSEYVNTIGGIDAQVDDEHPKYLCVSCHSLLQAAIEFRKTALQTEKSLKSDDLGCSMNYDGQSDDDFDFQESKVNVKADYHCQRCNLDFDHYEDYNNHKVSPEHESMKMKCPICNNLYAENYLKRHLLLHQADVPYVCDICGKKFVIQGQFNRHRLTHFYDLPFKCSLCPYRGRFTESLKMHMRTHTGDKPYQCSECAKCFINKSNLNKHMHIHKPEYDFKCETCGRGFNSRRNLDLHLKVDHTGIKDHVCNICGKAFGYRKQMMKHQLKVHKREKMRSGRLPLYLQVETRQKNGQDVLLSDSVALKA